MLTTPNTEHGPDWVQALSLFRTPGNSWDRARFDQFWVEVMVRRFAVEYPEFSTEWLTVSGWMRVLLRRVKPGDPPQPDWLENEIGIFLLRGGNRISSENPWCVMSRVTQKTIVKVAEYSITNIPALEKELQPPVPAPDSNAKIRGAIEALWKRIQDADQHDDVWEMHRRLEQLQQSLTEDK